MSEKKTYTTRSNRVFTIGFGRKCAREFFELLSTSGIKRIIDVRLNNVSQLAGFTKILDLEYFLQEISNIGYIHIPELAPSKDILDGYKKKEIDWPEYENRFRKLLVDRKAEDLLTAEDICDNCFLCSEPLPDKCHRRLVVEYLQTFYDNIEIFHL